MTPALLVALVLAVGVVGTMPRGALAQPAGYMFTPIAVLGDPAPGGGTFINDFEPGGINNLGEVAFVADVTIPSSGDEGVFLARLGQLSQLARAGLPAPGGGTFNGVELGRVALNDGGDVAFAFTLTPFTFPFGFNSGVYRFSHSTGALTAVVVPGVTPVPGGGVFAGTFFHTSLNNQGDLGFAGMVPASIGPGAPIGLGLGAFQADRHGQITDVALPGDPAPGGGIFDFVVDPWINDRGDVAFDGHLAGEECIKLNQDLPRFIFCATSVYVMHAATGDIESIAHQGEPAPGGGTYRLAFGPVMNNRGEIVFIGDLTPAPGAGDALAVFLHAGGTTIPVARPGDNMPGGGHLVRASFRITNYHLDNRGDVVFNATLDTDDNRDGIADTGLYVSSRGSLRLVARTGTVIPGVGTIAHLQPPADVGADNPHGGAIINEEGQVFFQATLTNGTGVLLVATPSP